MSGGWYRLSVWPRCLCHAVFYNCCPRKPLFVFSSPSFQDVCPEESPARFLAFFQLYPRMFLGNIWVCVLVALLVIWARDFDDIARPLYALWSLVLGLHHWGRKSYLFLRHDSRSVDLCRLCCFYDTATYFLGDSSDTLRLRWGTSHHFTRV